MADSDENAAIHLLHTDTGVEDGGLGETGNEMFEEDHHIDRPLCYVSSDSDSAHIKRVDSSDGEKKSSISGSSTELSSTGERKELVRINTCAVFHKLTPGQGVPHSFVGFVRQWPSLPRVVIFLSTRVIPIARVAVEERYQVTKVRTVPGFYGVTYCLGFRDDFEVNIDEVIRQICELEMNASPAGYPKTIQRIKDAAQISTHIVPHYHVVSKPVSGGRWSTAASYIRSALLEGVYRPIASMFPETGNWMGSADEIIHVGINAVI